MEGSRRAWMPLLALIAFLLVGASAQAATTLPVTKTVDDGTAGTLRNTIAAAADGDTVFLPASSSHYVVTMGEIPITHAITIKGEGVGSSIVDAQGNSRVFHTMAPLSSTGTVTFQSVKVTGGATTATPGGGGILVDRGNLVLDHAAFDGNTATVSMGATGSGGGGGIYNNDGSTTLIASSVSGNSASITDTTGCCQGGGGLRSANGTVTIEAGSTVNGNGVIVTGGPGELGGQNDDSGGGGVYQGAPAGHDLTVTDSSISFNGVAVNAPACCHGGGGIYNNSPNTTHTDITRSHVDSNSVSVTGPSSTNDIHCCSGGGALYSFGFISLTDSTMNGGGATVTAGGCCHGGGAVQADISSGDTVSITGSDLSGNTMTSAGARCCSGGGAVMLDAGGTGLTTTASLFSNNQALLSGGPTDSGGGAINSLTGGAATHYTNVTISGNSTNASGDGNGGGGIYAWDLIQPSSAGPDVFANSTLTGNSAPSGSGGGLFNEESKIQTKNTIIGGNSAGSDANCTRHIDSGDSPSVAPVFTSLGHNLEDLPDTCGFTGTGDLVVPQSALGLAPLADNGGPTKTHALLAGSAARDAGDPAGCTDANGGALTTDQRGFPRPVGPRCDIGAFEAALVPPAVSGLTGAGAPVRPALAGLAVSPKSFRAAGSGPTIVAARKRRKPGTRVSYRDTLAATTTFMVQRPTKGVRKGRKCVARPHKRSRKKLRACTLFVRVGRSFTHADVAGANHFRFTGRVSGRKLKPGRYRLQANASAAGLSSAPKTTAFKVIR